MLLLVLQLNLSSSLNSGSGRKRRGGGGGQTDRGVPIDPSPSRNQLITFISTRCGDGCLLRGVRSRDTLLEEGLMSNNAPIHKVYIELPNAWPTSQLQQACDSQGFCVQPRDTPEGVWQGTAGSKRLRSWTFVRLPQGAAFKIGTCSGVEPGFSAGLELSSSWRRTSETRPANPGGQLPARREATCR